MLIVLPLAASLIDRHGWRLKNVVLGVCRKFDCCEHVTVIPSRTRLTIDCDERDKRRDACRDQDAILRIARRNGPAVANPCPVSTTFAAALVGGAIFQGMRIRETQCPEQLRN